MAVSAAMPAPRASLPIAGTGVVDAARGGPSADAARGDAAGGDAARSDAARSDAARSDAARSDAARSDAARSDAARSDAARSDAARSDAAPSLAARLRPLTTVAALTARDGDLLRCTACAHRCVLGPGRTGSCGVRFEQDGEVRAPFGYVARTYVRPVETNTIFHVLPGALALTFGMFGCDLRCPYCHNWKVSQALREGIDDAPRPTTPAALVDEAIAAGARVICAAYNEPMIAAEWVVAVFTEARRRGLVTAIVSDGNTTSEALAHVQPVTDVFRVDLKGSTPDQYRQLGGRLEPVLAAIAEARALGMWVEVVTLVVPGLNDDEPGLGRLAGQLAAIDVDIPWHLNAFVPRYKLVDRPRTAIPLLVSVAGTAYARGLRHVYVGNVAREFPHLGHTRCPSCAEELVTRLDYRTTGSRLVDGDRCPSCATRVAGMFGA